MKFTIFKRLTFGYLAIMLLVLFMGGFVSFKLNQLNHITKEINAIDSTTIRTSAHLIDALISQVGFEKKFFIAPSIDFYKQFWEINNYILQDFEILRPLVREPQLSRTIIPAEALYSRYVSIFKEEASQFDKTKAKPTPASLLEKNRITNDIHGFLQDVIKSARSNQEHKIEESSQITAQVLNTTIVTAVIIFLTGSLISFLNTRQINRSIIRLQERTREIANGKFDGIIDMNAPPEIVELTNDFNTMCQRLKELDEMKRDFISHVSHELRTPLTAIREASSMLIEGTYAQSPDKQHELLAITKEECERLIESVNRILDLSRMEAKMMVYHFNDGSLATLIQKVVTKLTPIAQRKNVHLSMEVPTDLPLVRMDVSRIGQVLENLLGNAFKFTSERDSITITASVQMRPDAYVLVTVHDSGCGMAKENLHKIFNKFHRIEDGMGTVRGTGLGLAIAKHIISAHGGRIWAESEVGQWSTFFFTLPLA